MSGSDRAAVADRFELATAVETEAFGRDLGAAAPAGAWVLLSGELGSGKTTLVRGMAAGMGVLGRVTSPTFVLLHEHQTPVGERRPPIHAHETHEPVDGGTVGDAQSERERPKGLLHTDLYRIRSAAEAAALALDEYADRGWVVAVEWPAHLYDAVPGRRPLSLNLVETRSGARAVEVVTTAVWAPPILARWIARP